MKLHLLITKSCRVTYMQRCYLKQPSHYPIFDSNINLHSLSKTRYEQNIKRNSVQIDNMQTSLQILGTGGCAGSKSIIITLNGAKIMFNCGESTLRVANEYKQKMSRVSHVCITSVTWDNVGGLIGLLQTLKTVGTVSITLYGPKRIQDLYQGSKNFLQLKRINVQIKSAIECESFEHETGSTISCIPIKQLSSSNVQNSQNDCEYKTNESGKRVIVEESGEKKKMRIEERKSADAMCYIFKAKDSEGKLCLEKALNLGVEIGPNLSQLKSGKDVVLPDGTVIHHEDVCAPPIVGPTILVIDCPTEDHLESLVNHSSFKKYQAAAEDDNNTTASCIVHCTPTEVINHSHYKDWMHKFGKEAYHIIVNEDNTCLGNLDVYKKQHQLHLIHPEIFPLLDETLLLEEKEKNHIDDRLSVCYPRTMYNVYWKPNRTLEPCLKSIDFINTYKDELINIPGFETVLDNVKKKIEDKRKSLTNLKDYPQTIMLGTASAAPSKSRNVSGILVRLDEKHSIVLDCGEGTYGQMLRLYGKSKIKDILSTIQAVYVSHIHTDHHMGLIGILRERKKVTTDPLYLLIPTAMEDWLTTYNSRVESVLDECIIIPNEHLLLTKNHLQIEKKNRLYKALNVQKLNTVLVQHCFNSFGISFTVNDGEKIVYSGDTMPCESLIALGKNCDLLIHEATMFDDLKEDAIRKRHSTVSQAIDIGKRMEANFILLTHFSQRYPKLQNLPNVDDSKYDNVAIAFDNMRINYWQLSILPLLYPCLMLLYKGFLE